MLAAHPLFFVMKLPDNATGHELPVTNPKSRPFIESSFTFQKSPGSLGYRT